MKRLILLTLMIFLMPFVTGLALCDTNPEPNVTCRFVTPSLNCTSYNYSIFNTSSGTIIKDNYPLTVFEGDKYQFNFSEEAGGYVIELCDNTFREVIVKRNETMELAMIIGLGIIAFLLVFIAYFISNEFFLLKMFFIFGALFMSLLIPSTIINGVALTQDNFFTSLMRLLVIFVIYVFIHFNYWLWLKNILVKIGIIKNKTTP